MGQNHTKSPTPISASTRPLDDAFTTLERAVEDEWGIEIRSSETRNADGVDCEITRAVLVRTRKGGVPLATSGDVVYGDKYAIGQQAVQIGGIGNQVSQLNGSAPEAQDAIGQTLELLAALKTLVPVEHPELQEQLLSIEDEVENLKAGKKSGRLRQLVSDFADASTIAITIHTLAEKLLEVAAPLFCYLPLK